jgi:small-conductance mechanosensitive channel
MQNMTRFIIIILILLLSCFDATLEAQQDPTSTETVLEQVDPRSVEDIKKHLDELKKQIEGFKKPELDAEAAVLGVTAPDLKERANLLGEIVDAYESLLVALEKQQELDNKGSELNALQKVDYPEKPPYFLSRYDELLSALDKAVQDSKALTKEIDMGKKLVNDAELDLQAADSIFIASKNNLQKAEIEPHESRLTLKWNAQKEQLKRELASVWLQLHQTNLANSEKKLVLANQDIEIKRAHSQWVWKNLQYNKEDLSNQLQSIKKRKDKISSQLKVEQKKLKDAESALIRAEKTLVNVKTETDYNSAKAQIKASKLHKDNYELMSKQSEDNLILLKQQEKLWTQRYALIQGNMDYKTLVAMQSEAQKELENIIQSISVVQDSQIRLQLQLSEIEKELSLTSPTSSIVAPLKDQLDILRESAAHAFEYLTLLQSTKSMYQRMIDEIHLKKEEVNLQKKIIAFVQATLEYELFNNSTIDYLLALLILISVIALSKLIKTLIFKRFSAIAARTTSSYDDFLIYDIQRMAIPIFYFAALYLSLNGLNLHSILVKLINIMGIVVLTFYIGRFLISQVEYLTKDYWLKKEENLEHESAIKAILPVLKIIIWCIGVFFLLDNLGFKISTVVTGLGIGGIAVALASKNILGDLFNYFVILFDRPFEIGDFVVVGDYMGLIEHIGIKTTRLKSIGGELLVISNTDLASARIKNYKHMEKRRVAFKIGVAYDTQLNHLKKIPNMIGEIIKSTQMAEFDRAHFFLYGEASLIFEIVYFVKGNETRKYMDIQQSINLALKDAFDKEGIVFAFPK